MKKLAAQFCYHALRGAADLSPGERADYYDFAAKVLAAHDMTDMARAAKAASEDLRNAEASQLQFHALLSSAHN